MNVIKPQHNWWIDAVLFIGYLFCFTLDLTGTVGHEWLGLLVGGLGLLHLLVHWKWVVSVFRRFNQGTGTRNRLYLLTDMMLAFGFAGILVTGLVISTWLNLNLAGYAVWLDVHIAVSIVALVVTLLKIGLHWRWVVNITARVFSGVPKPVVIPGGLVPARQPVRVDEDRRKFLAVMGVAGLGSTLALLNLGKGESLLASAAAAAEVVAQTDALTPTAESTVSPQTVGLSESPTAVTTETANPTVTLEDVQPTATAQPPATACTIQCNRRCSFPGHCRRYTDQNGNGKCDLGECL